jgi:hypothetical protein
MYRHSFSNHPDLTAAINEVGIPALLRLLRTESDFSEWIESGGSVASSLVELIDSQVLERFSTIPNDAMTPEAIATVLSDVNKALPSMNPEGTHSLQGFIDCGGYVIMNYSALVSQLDASGPEAATFVLANKADWYRLYKNQFECREKDPSYIAYSYVLGISHTNMDAYRVLEKSLERIIEKELRKDAQWLANYHNDTPFYRVRDWVKSAVDNNAPWLSNVDEHGCPKKLAKCSSLEALVAEADKQMKKDLDRSGSVPASWCRVFAEDGGPFNIVRLNSRAALDDESNRMRHCIGNGGYDHLIGREDHLLLSLRDRNGQSHATIEVIDKQVVQFQGKANSTPKDEYREAAERLLLPLGCVLPRVTELRGQLSAGALRAIRQWVESNPNSGIDLRPHNPWAMDAGR